MIDAAVMLIKQAKAIAEQSVDYTPNGGAACPACGVRRLKVVTSRPWEDKIKIRFHKCKNQECLLCRMDISIKSVQAID